MEQGTHINLEKARFLLLSSATEDYTGRYEAIWEFNAVFSNSSVGEKYRVAELVIRELFSRVYTKFHKWIFTDDYRDYAIEPVHSDDVSELLSEPTAWYPNYNHIRIVSSSTEAGEHAYFSGVVPFIA